MPETDQVYDKGIDSITLKTNDEHANDQDLQDPYLRTDQLYQNIINAMTFSEIHTAIDDAAPND